MKWMYNEHSLSNSLRVVRTLQQETHVLQTNQNVPRVLQLRRHDYSFSHKCTTSMLWLRCAGRRLNNLFRGIQLLK